MRFIGDDATINVIFDSWVFDILLPKPAYCNININEISPSLLVFNFLSCKQCKYDKIYLMFDLGLAHQINGMDIAMEPNMIFGFRSLDIGALSLTGLLAILTLLSAHH